MKAENTLDSKQSINDFKTLDILIPLPNNEYGYIFTYTEDGRYLAECWEDRYQEDEIFAEDFVEVIGDISGTNYLEEGDSMEEVVEKAMDFWDDFTYTKGPFKIEEMSFKEAATKVRKKKWSFILFISPEK